MDAQRYPHGDLSSKVIRSFYETYNALGSGFVESVYENAFAVQLALDGLDVQRQRPITVHFRGHAVGDFRPDVIVEDRILVEIKAVSGLLPVHEAQLINYLKVTGFQLGLLVNFGPRPQIRRRIV